MAHVDDLIAPYVLGALESAEITEVELHLEACTQCRQHLAESQRVVDLLPYAVAEATPPPDLKTRLMDRLEKSRASALPRLQAVPAKAPTSTASATRTLEHPLLRALVPLAAVLILAVGGLGIWAVSLQGQLTEQRAANQRLSQQILREAQLVRLLSTPDTVIQSLNGGPPAPRAWGKMVMNPSQPVALFVGSNLPSLPPGKVYQLWLIKEGSDRISGGLFTTDPQGWGELWIEAPQPLASYEAVGITVEPEGGSPSPTSERVLGASLY